MTKREKDITDIDRFLHYGMPKKEMFQFSKRLVSDKALAKEFALQKAKLEGNLDNEHLAALQLVLKQNLRRTMAKYIIGVVLAIVFIGLLGWYMMTR